MFPVLFPKTAAVHLISTESEMCSRSVRSEIFIYTVCSALKEIRVGIFYVFMHREFCIRGYFVVICDHTNEEAC